MYAGAILFPPSTVGASALRDGGRLGSLAPWLGRFPSPPQRSAAFAGIPRPPPPCPSGWGRPAVGRPHRGLPGPRAFPPGGGADSAACPSWGAAPRDGGERLPLLIGRVPRAPVSHWPSGRRGALRPLPGLAAGGDAEVI